MLVGDGGFEPPTSTMSTWRSTPELIALSICYPKRADNDTQASHYWQYLTCQPIADAKPHFPNSLNFIPKAGRLLELQVAGMLQHAFFEFQGLFE